MSHFTANFGQKYRFKIKNGCCSKSTVSEIENPKLHLTFIKLHKYVRAVVGDEPSWLFNHRKNLIWYNPFLKKWPSKDDFIQKSNIVIFVESYIILYVLYLIKSLQIGVNSSE